MASSKSKKTKKKSKPAAAEPFITALSSHNGTLFAAKSDGSLWERHVVPATETEPEDLVWKLHVVPSK